jgi:hypothetical protein
MQKALKHLILHVYKIQKKRTTRYSLSPPRHAAIYLQKTAFTPFPFLFTN